MSKNSNRRKANNDNTVELTDTQKNILKIRKRMNRRELEQEQFKGFTKEKQLTYLWIFLFTPYGIYRLFDKKNEFLLQQKYIWTIVSIVYVVCLVNQLFKLF